MIHKKVPIALVGLILQLEGVPTTHANYGLIIFVASAIRDFAYACHLSTGLINEDDSKTIVTR